MDIKARELREAMFESPRSLQDVCFDFISDNIFAICEVHFCSNAKPLFLDSSSSIAPTIEERLSCSCIDEGSSCNGLAEKRLKFRSFNKDPDVFLPTQVSDRLLERLCEKKALSDLAITLFDVKTTRLKHVRLKDTSRLSKQALAILKQHKVVELQADQHDIVLDELIACLGNWSLQNLKSLSVARYRITHCYRDDNFRVLQKLQGLRSLNVAGTMFNSGDLVTLVENLQHLEILDISCTRVKDLTPLKRCKDRLKSLAIYDLTIGRESISSVFPELNELRVLDMSKNAFSDSLRRPEIDDFLNAVHILPHLISLDISGAVIIQSADLKRFITTHPQLRFLGLVYSHGSYIESLWNPSHIDYRSDLRVSGTASEAQIFEALRRYPDRSRFVQKSLYHLFELMQRSSEPRVDVINFALQGMRAHSDVYSVQLAGTACLYVLTKGSLAAKIHSSVLKQIVDHTLATMELYRDHRKVLPFCLRILHNDRILHDVAFDKSKCAGLTLHCLTVLYDAAVIRMCIAICSIVMTKISKIETPMLHVDNKQIYQLLKIVEKRARWKYEDNTMRFTLNVLWMLTDGNATTCELFLEGKGLAMFVVVLENFRGIPSAETKALGTFNNIAEIGELRHQLMQPEVVTMLPLLLESEDIRVSFFAAGITAYLLSDGPSAWSDHPKAWKSDTSMPDRSELLDQLTKTVASWQTPNAEIVGYHSFRPFFPLLRCTEAYPVQLWAVWAINHACTKNPKRHCGIFTSEGGEEILKSLEKDVSEGETQPNVRGLCRSILDTLSLHPC